MKTSLFSLARCARHLSGVLSVGMTLLLLSPATSIAQSQEVVFLGAAGDFAILSGSLISNIPTSDVTGNIGLSPAAGSNITGFGGTEVTGIIYTVDATGPAGSVTSAAMLTTAKGDITIAYNDAAGRQPVPSGEFLNPGSGDIGGLTLVAGLYKFTGGLAISGSDVTLTGSDTDVWIFQIVSNLVVASDIQVILAGGAQPANIFWQVGTSATLGTSSIFKGTILADQSISLSTGAILDGRALASIGAVTLDANTVTTPGLITAIDNERVPNAFNLEQNYPNPFNPSTSIEYSIAKAYMVELSVFNLLGQNVKTLVNSYKTAGRHMVSLNAADFASGVYFYRIQAGDFVQIKKMIFVK